MNGAESETVYVPGTRARSWFVSAAWTATAAGAALLAVTWAVVGLSAGPDAVVDHSVAILFEPAILIVPGLFVLALNFAHWASQSLRLAAMTLSLRERAIGLRTVILVLLSPVAVVVLLLVAVPIGHTLYPMVEPLLR